jgi:outer membrane protein OmpA-like peptidoglycan-associated protein
VTAGANVCSITSAGTIVVSSAGTCDITATQPGDTTYAAASPVTRSLVVRAGLPGIPHLMAVGAGDSKLTVSYSEPPTDGGSPIVAYVITATDTTGTSFTKSDCDTTSFSCTIEGLTNGTEYRTTVAAITGAGAGSPSRSSEPLAPFIAPQGARDITGNRSDSTLVVSWTEPESLGGGTLVRYDVSLRPEGGDFADPTPVTPLSRSSISTRSASSRSSHTFRNLRNGVSYDVRIVTITTRASSAAPSNTAQAVALPMITPDAPRDLRLESLDGTSAIATWATPLKDGGSPLTRYTVNTNRGSCTLDSPLATKCRITGLDSGSSLTFTIRSVTTLGNSDPETVTLSLPEKPGAPTLNEVTRAGTSAEVVWSAPSSTGGRPVTSYRAIATSTLDPTDIQRCSTAATTCTIRNLTPTSAYTFTVRAINSVGTSAPSAGITVGGTSAIPSVWGTPSFGAASARRVLALPPGPQAVKVRAAGARNRTNVTAVAPPTNVAISHAIITVAGTKGKVIARIKVAVDKDDPTASVTIPYASSKVRIGVQFANDYGISKLSAKSFLVPKFVTNRNDAAANVLPGKPGPEIQAKRMGKAVYFVGASAQLDTADKAELRRIATQIKREGGLVWVTGWARRSPTTSNAFMVKVSEQRAIAVAHYLSTLGIQQWIRFNGAGAPTTTTGTDTDRRVDVAVSPLD